MTIERNKTKLDKAVNALVADDIVSFDAAIAALSDSITAANNATDTSFSMTANMALALFSVCDAGDNSGVVMQTFNAKVCDKDDDRQDVTPTLNWATLEQHFTGHFADGSVLHREYITGLRDGVACLSKDVAAEFAEIDVLSGAKAVVGSLAYMKANKAKFTNTARENAEKHLAKLNAKKKAIKRQVERSVDAAFGLLAHKEGVEAPRSYTLGVDGIVCHETDADGTVTDSTLSVDELIAMAKGTKDAPGFVHTLLVDKLPDVANADEAKELLDSKKAKRAPRTTNADITKAGPVIEGVMRQYASYDFGNDADAMESLAKLAAWAKEMLSKCDKDADVKEDEKLSA